MKKTSLFFERRKGESFIIGEGRDAVHVTVSRIRQADALHGAGATLIINAPPHIKVDRAERRLGRE